MWIYKLGDVGSRPSQDCWRSLQRSTWGPVNGVMYSLCWVSCLYLYIDVLLEKSIQRLLSEMGTLFWFCRMVHLVVRENHLRAPRQRFVLFAMKAFIVLVMKIFSCSELCILRLLLQVNLSLLPNYRRMMIPRVHSILSGRLISPVPPQYQGVLLYPYSLLCVLYLISTSR